MDACRTLVQALVVSRLDYASSLLFGINQGHLRKLQRLQDSAARLIFRAPLCAAPLRQQLHWLPVHDRINFRIVTYVYKSLHGTAPVYLAELLTTVQQSRNLRSGDSHRLKVKRTKSKMGEKGFEYCGPVLWNNLAENIKCSKNVIMFKKLLKTFYFQNAYNL